MQQGKKVTMMRVMAPIGVFRRPAWRSRSMAPLSGAFPSPAACLRSASPSPRPPPPTLEKLKKGGKANFIIYEAPGVGIRLPITLNGPSKALVELAKL